MANSFTATDKQNWSLYLPLTHNFTIIELTNINALPLWLMKGPDGCDGGFQCSARWEQNPQPPALDRGTGTNCYLAKKTKKQICWNILKAWPVIVQQNNKNPQFFTKTKAEVNRLNEVMYCGLFTLLIHHFILRICGEKHLLFLNLSFSPALFSKSSQLNCELVPTNRWLLINFRPVFFIEHVQLSIFYYEAFTRHGIVRLN